MLTTYQESQHLHGTGKKVAGSSPAVASNTAGHAAPLQGAVARRTVNAQELGHFRRGLAALDELASVVDLVAR